MGRFIQHTDLKDMPGTPPLRTNVQLKKSVLAQFIDAPLRALRNLWISYVRKSPKRLGRYGEYLALKFLQSHGYIILERNWRNPLGEIDLVAADGKTLAIVEVKTRRAEVASIYAPDKAVTADKSARLLRLARYYIQQNELTLCRRRLTKVRFEIIAITVSTQIKASIEHIKSVSFVGLNPKKH